MKPIYSLLLMCSLFFSGTFWAYSATITVVESQEQNIGSTFNYFANHYKSQLPESYKYISLKYNNISPDSDLYTSLQILVYLDLIKNTSKAIPTNHKLTKWEFYTLAEHIFNTKINISYDIEELNSSYVTNVDFIKVSQHLEEHKQKAEALVLPWNKTAQIQQKTAIFNDVYNTLSSEHYSNTSFDKLDLMDSAIEWIAKGTNDKHTVYFPPTESKSFTDGLAGEYEWIWAYVDMEKPGEMKIVSPIPWSPAEKAWLKWGDIITKVENKEVTELNSLTEVVSWIKWPTWSIVTLTIKREKQVFQIKVTREKIVLNNIEEKKLDYRTYYIQIKTFWSHVSDDFKKSLENIKADKNIKEIIIDLRNNGGGFLWEVTQMLSFVIPKWDTTAVVRYLKDEYSYISKWYDIIDLNKYKIVMLQNTGTASASEIFIGTIKDYFPNTTTLWEKTYGKWSVQTIKNYTDGSTLKYTIAKWFTGKTQTGIDGIWITPDIEIEFDFDNYQKTKIDNQLEKAKKIY